MAFRRTPNDENGPDGYPRENEAFRKASSDQLKERQQDLDEAEKFLRGMRQQLRAQLPKK